MVDLIEDKTALTEANRRTVERFFEAGKALDIETIFGMFDPGVTMHIPPGLPHSGDHVGIEAMMEAFVPVASIFDITEAQCEARIADGDRVVMLIDLPMHNGGSVRIAEVYRLEEGKIVDIRVFYWDTTAVVA